MSKKLVDTRVATNMSSRWGWIGFGLNKSSLFRGVDSNAVQPRKQIRRAIPPNAAVIPIEESIANGNPYPPAGGRDLHAQVKIWLDIESEELVERNWWHPSTLLLASAESIASGIIGCACHHPPALRTETTRSLYGAITCETPDGVFCYAPARNVY